MAAVGISEFTFGYAFLHEQTTAHWPNLRAAPILPSLRQEAEVAWDAHLPLLGTDFYYQFKLADFLKGRNARYIADGTYSAPYYRLALHRRDNNRQHQRLRAHCLTHPHTYYVAPEFNSLEQFNLAFLSKQISAQSRVIPLKDCRDYFDSDQHYITFQQGNASWSEHSDRIDHERAFFGREMETVYRSTQSEWRSVDEQFAVELFESTSQTIREVVEREDKRRLDIPRLLDFDYKNQDRARILLRVADLLAVGLGLTLVIAGQPNTADSTFPQG